ncbi:MAG: ATP-dependent zinc metalloprotease FtsH [Bacilli bacterium]|nr:ATP-dependent zinc metalloprotease FtsH [Bacilli bacterium]
MKNVTTWNTSNIDTQLVDNHIKTADIYDKDTVVTVEGIYVNKENAEKRYTFTCDTAWFNYSFDHDADPSTPEHASYRSLFKVAIEKYKTDFPTKAADAYMSDHYAFEVSWFDQWGPTIIIAAVTLIIAIFLFSRLSSSVNSTNNRAMDFNKSRARRVDTSKVRFSDVAGCDEEKAEMQEVVQYLKEPQKFSKYGAKLPKGILLVGNPGTGKTLLAKAVAGEAGVPFYSISGSDFVEMFVGVGAGRVRDMFRRAKQTAPCLIFIDEIDAVGRQRGAGLGGGNDEREQTLNQLLVEMDGFEDNSGIIVIAATNRDDVLDPALLRAGRFDRTITVNLPDKKGREAIFKVHARGKLIDPKVDFEALAKRTVGFSGADIENILNEAAILAVRQNEPMITLKDIDEAIDRRIAGPAKSSKGMNEEERKRVAFHEAGHAIIGLKLEHSDKVQKITIIPRGRTGGHVLMTPEDDRFLLSKAELEAKIIGYLGGRSSEEIFFNDVTTGAQNDIEVATRIARSMVTEYGMSSLGPIQYERDSGSVFLGRDYTSTQKNFSTQIAFEIDTEVRKIIDEAHTKAIKIITDNKSEVELIAKTLLENETITAEEIGTLLKEGKLSSETAKVETVSEEKTEKADKAE